MAGRIARVKAKTQYSNNSGTRCADGTARYEMGTSRLPQDEMFPRECFRVFPMGGVGKGAAFTSVVSLPLG